MHLVYYLSICRKSFCFIFFLHFHVYHKLLDTYLNDYVERQKSLAKKNHLFGGFHLNGTIYDIERRRQHIGLVNEDSGGGLP